MHSCIARYVGLWRYVEMRVFPAHPLHTPVRDAGLGFEASQWVVHYPWADEASFVSSHGLLDDVCTCRERFSLPQWHWVNSISSSHSHIRAMRSTCR